MSTNDRPLPAPGRKPEPPKAQHGARSEVNWEGGSGRQPYANRGEHEVVEGHQGEQYTAGDRGELSGRNREQLDEVLKKP